MPDAIVTVCSHIFIYSLLSEKYSHECRNISVKITCDYLVYLGFVIRQDVRNDPRKILTTRQNGLNLYEVVDNVSSVINQYKYYLNSL